MIVSASPTVRAAIYSTMLRYPTITIAGVLGPTRLAVYTEARSYTMAILRARGWTLKQIATGLKRADHTTALNSIRRAEKLFPEVDFVCLANNLQVDPMRFGKEAVDA
jgi:chromosomal replication initiation ATPase DnaA